MIAESCVFHGRVVMIGNASVGKTSILNRLVDQKFNEYEHSTVGANYQLYSTEIHDIHVELQIWDTAGQEKYRSLGPIYFRNAVGAIIVYDVTNVETFDSIDEWVRAFTEVAGNDAIIYIVGNKCDLEDEIQVSEIRAKEYAEDRGFIYSKTSAKTGKGIVELFQTLSERIIHVKEMGERCESQIKQTRSGCC